VILSLVSSFPTWHEVLEWLVSVYIESGWAPGYASRFVSSAV